MTLTASRNGSLLAGILTLTLASLANAQNAAPQLTETFQANSIPVNSQTTLTFTLSNPNSSDLTSVQFTDQLPTGLQVPGSTGTSSCGTTNFYSDHIVQQPFTLAANSSCQIQVTLQATQTGALTNTTSAVGSDQGTGNAASASLNVVAAASGPVGTTPSNPPDPPAPPSIAVAFGAASVPLNGSTSLTLTITNPNSVALTGVAFTDALPAGLLVGNPNGLTNSCAGNVAAAANSASISLTGGTIAANGSCSVVANVSAGSAGVENNTTSAVSSNEGGSGNAASASLAVEAPPTFKITFGTANVAPNVPVLLTFAIGNPSVNAGPLTGLNFADTLPSGLQVANPNGLSNTCGGSTSAAANSSSISLSGGSVAAGNSCTVVVNVIATSPGVRSNAVSSVSSIEGGSGAGGSATLTVIAPPVAVNSFNAGALALNGSTTMTISISNPAVNPVALTNVSFSDNFPTGLVVSPSSALSTSCALGMASTSANSVSLAGATLAPGASCAVSVNVTVTAAGTKSNTVMVTSDEGSATASAQLGVFEPLTLAESFQANAVALNSTTNLTFTIANPDAIQVTGVGFSDALPDGLIVANPNGLLNTCGGTVTAAANSGTIALNAGTITPNGSCSFALAVAGTSPGVKSNGTSAITSNEAGLGSPASASVTVVGTPALTEAFAPSKLMPKAVTTLSFNITNSNSVAFTGLGFTDQLPNGLVIASPAGLSNTCGGTAAATPNSTMVTLAGGTLGANSSCSVTVNVLGKIDGIFTNTTGPISSNEGGTGISATATLVVALPPVIAKSYAVLAMPANGTTTLSFTVGNPNQLTSLSGISFTDALPSGLEVATPSQITGDCGGGAISAVSGSTNITLTGASLDAPGSCTFSVNVTATSTGAILNTTQPVTSNEAVAGAPASATLTVGSVFENGYAANLNAGDSVINITNTGENGARLYGPGFGDPAGNICVNVYAFSPDEQLLSCCSCVVTPDGLASLSVKNDLLSNTLTGIRPNSVSVKLLATLAGSDGSGTNCTNSAAIPGTLASGMAAWGTSLHAAPGSTGQYAVTETPYASVVLSGAELTSLANRCAFIVGNGSSFGICRSCRPGGLGAERQ